MGGERLCAGTLRANALAHSLELDAQLQLGCATRIDLSEKRSASRSIQHRPRLRFELLVCRDGGGERGFGFVHLLGRELHPVGKPGTLGLGSIQADAKLAELLGSGREVGVVLAQRRQCSRGMRLRTLECPALLREREAGSLDLGCYRGQPRCRDVALRNELDA